MGKKSNMAECDEGNVAPRNVQVHCKKPNVREEYVDVDVVLLRFFFAAQWWGESRTCFVQCVIGRDADVAARAPPLKGGVCCAMCERGFKGLNARWAAGSCPTPRRQWRNDEERHGRKSSLYVRILEVVAWKCFGSFDLKYAFITSLIQYVMIRFY